MKSYAGAYHPYITHRNTTFYWDEFGGDNEKQFEEKYKTIVDMGDDTFTHDMEHYKNNPIEYKLNNYGFRCDDFDNDEPGNLFIGCSHTKGIGHYLEAGWAHMVNEHIGGRYYNISFGGASAGSGFRLFNWVKDKINIKNVFVFFPHAYRTEFVNTDDLGFYEELCNHTKFIIFSPQWPSGAGTMVNWDNDNGDYSGKHLRRSLINDEWAYHYNLTNIFAMYALATSIGAKFYYKSNFTPNSIIENKNTPCYHARDMHAPSWIYSGFAHEMIHKINNDGYIKSTHEIIHDYETRVEEGKFQDDNPFQAVPPPSKEENKRMNKTNWDLIKRMQ